MKTLINCRAVLSTDKKSVTITADIVDRDFNALLTTRVTHGHLNPDHIRHARRIQSSNQSVFLESRFAKVSIPNEFIATVAAAIEPLTTFAPVFKKSSVPLNVETISETPVTYQWQISDNAFPEGTHPPPIAIWEDIKNATRNVLDESLIKDGQWIRCIATNATGSTATQPAQKKIKSK